MIKKLNLFVMFALTVCGLRAQYVAPSEGVFRIINAEYNAALAETESATLYCTEIGGNTDYSQLWYLKPSGSNFTLQNLGSMMYIQNGNIEHEKAYWTGLFPKAFNIVENTNKGKNVYNIWDPTYKDPSLGTIGLHSKGKGEKVVRWNSENHKSASEWKFVSVEVPEDYLKELEAYQKELEKENTILESGDAYQAALANVFEDQACTKLKANYAAMDESSLRSTLEGMNLPEALVEMTLKIKNGNWAEDNDNAEKPGWSSDYAKKFRVQMVEPYSVAGEITEWIGHQGHSNMDNPTGLYANKRDFIYVFVEGEIKEGAELWLTWLNGHTKMPNYNNGYSNGVVLKSGLNIVPFSVDGSALYFNYLVHTYDKETKKFTNKLSNYDDLKIHVEGGYINGYYNVVGDALYTPDTDADWVYYEERANLDNITILGRYEVLQFELNDVTHTETKDGKTETWFHRGLAALFPEELPKSLPENQRINAIVEAWDRIFLSEKMTLGVASKAEVDSANKLFPRYDATWTEKAEIYNYDGYAEFCDSLNPRENLDYGEYYNHHGLAFGTRSGYMYGSWDHSGYHINTTPSILTAIATEAGPTWGPGHEIGHQHQALFTLNGQMEVTNNLFANISVWYMGMGTSRINGTEGRLEDAYYVHRTGGDLFGYETKHIWVMTQMYYRLWLYYHRVGNNTQFYPRLFELLRKNPMERSYANGSTVLPGETQTTSFQYTSGRKSYVHFYQLCCEAAQEDLTEFFRAYGYFVPVKDRFVGDYTNSMYTLTQEEIDEAIAEVKAKNYPLNKKALFINDCTKDATYGHDGKTQREFWDSETGRGLNGEVGNYIDYLAKTAISGKYLYTLSDLEISIAGGDGAVGFAIYNDKDEIVAFSNNHKFVLNEEVSNLLRSGKATLVAVPAEGEDVIIPSKAVGGSETEQLNALREKLAEAKKLVGMIDGTGKKIGWLLPEYAADLKKCVADVDAVVANEDQSVHVYGEWYTLLDATLASLVSNVDARVTISDNCFYSIVASNDITLTMEYTTDGLKSSLLSGADFASQWKFVPAAEEGTYYLQHRTTGNYISAANKGVRVKAKSTSVDKAVAFVFVPGEVGEFLIQRADNSSINLYSSKESRKTKQILAGDLATNNSTGSACWAITLMDDLDKLPETSNDSERITYYIQETASGENLCQYLSGRYIGRVTKGIPTSMDDNNYLFYFRAGSEKGKYTIYNCATEKAVTIDSKNYLMLNQEAETPVEYTIAPTEDGKSFTISAEAGSWFLSSYATISTTSKTAFRFQQVGCPTGIEEVVVNKPVNCDLYFDLMGRPVENPGAGIYIHNGKKVVIRD